MWDEILWLRQCVTVSQSSCSCILQTRFKMLLAISQMQVRLSLGEEQTLQVGQWGPSSLGSSQDKPRICCSCLILPVRTPAVGQ